MEKKNINRENVVSLTPEQALAIAATATATDTNHRSSHPRTLFVRACAVSHLAASVRGVTMKGIKVSTQVLAVEAHASHDVDCIVIEVETERNARETVFVRVPDGLRPSSFGTHTTCPYLGADTIATADKVTTTNAGDASRLVRVDSALAAAVSACEQALDLALAGKLTLDEARAAAGSKIPKGARGAQPSTQALASLDSAAGRLGLSVTVGRAVVGAKGDRIVERLNIDLRTA